MLKFTSDPAIYKFEKYKTNLSIVSVNGDDFIKSYETHVAKIDYKKRTINVKKYYSQTTSKHINYVAKQLNLKVKL